MLQQNMPCFATIILSLIQLKSLDALLLFSNTRNIKPSSLKKGNHIVICLLIKFNCIINKLNKSNEFTVITKAFIIDICLPKGKVMQTEKPLISYVFDMRPENFVLQLFIILLIHQWNLFFSLKVAYFLTHFILFCL